MGATMKALSCLLTIALWLTSANPVLAAQAADLRVTLLGTGIPEPQPDRFGHSILVEAGEQKLLIDAGRGASIRLWQLGVQISEIDALFITHYHSDHTIGIPDLWLTGWTVPT